MNAQYPVTLLLSVYNGASTLDRCFESLQKQTYQNFSLLCINDASTDTSLEKIQRWQKILGSKRLSIITHEKNQGLTQSLNSGLKQITTPFTARIDDDDWWDERKLDKQMQFLNEHSNYGLIGCNYINIAYGKSKEVRCPETDEEIKKSIFQRNPFAHSTVIFNTALAKKVGGYDEKVRYGQDYDLWFRMMPHTKFFNIQEFLCSRNSESGISFEKQNAQMLQCMKTQIKYLRRYAQPLTEYRCLFEPLAVILTPGWIKKMKRAHFS